METVQFVQVGKNSGRPTSLSESWEIVESFNFTTNDERRTNTTAIDFQLSHRVSFYAS